MTGPATLLPTPSRRTVFPDGAPVVHPKTPTGRHIFNWVQGPGFVLGNTGTELVLVEAGTSRHDDRRSSGIIACAALPDGIIRRAHRGSQFHDAKNIDGTDTRGAWLDLCRQAAERFPENAGDLNRFIVSEQARFERADILLARDDVSVISDSDVEQGIDVNRSLWVSRRLFRLCSIDDTTTATINDGIGYIGDFYVLRRPGARAVHIYQIKKDWLLHAPWRSKDISFSTIEEAFFVYTKEALSLGTEDLSGHEKITYFEFFNEALAWIEAAGGLSSLFLPRL